MKLHLYRALIALVTILSVSVIVKECVAQNQTGSTATATSPPSSDDAKTIDDRIADLRKQMDALAPGSTARTELAQELMELKTRASKEESPAEKTTAEVPQSPRPESTSSQTNGFGYVPIPRKLDITYVRATATADGIEMPKGMTLWTSEMVRAPCRFDVTVKVKQGGLTLWYSTGMVRISSEADAKLQLQAPRGPRNNDGVGSIPKDQWVTISWVLNRDSIAILIDGKKLVVQSAADSEGITAPLAIIADKVSAFEIKSATATELSARPVTDPAAIMDEEIAAWRKSETDQMRLKEQELLQQIIKTRNSQTKKTLADERRALLKNLDDVKKMSRADIADEIVAPDRVAEAVFKEREVKVAEEIKEFRAAFDAAAAGDVQATADLGYMLTFGGQIPVERSEGIALLMKAADLGSAGAMYCLGGIAGFKTELQKEWYRKAAALGHRNAASELEQQDARPATPQEPQQFKREVCPRCQGKGNLEGGTAGSSGLMDKITGGNGSRTTRCPTCDGTGKKK